MSWKTVKLKEVCHIEKGSTGIMKAIPGDYPIVTMAEERKTHNEYQFDAKAIIIPMVSGSGHGKASINRIHYQEGKFAVGTILCAVIPKDHDILEPLFLYHYCDVFKEELFVPLMRGMANVTLPMKALEELEIPLPSIDFQRKWLARFEHISEKQTALGEELTLQRSLLARLRQSILQDAVQGRLTAQWRQAHPNQEPASELLRRIREAKAASGKKEKTLPPVREQEKPFELPEGWMWCRLGEVANLAGRIGWKGLTASEYTQEGPLFLSVHSLNYGDYVDFRDAFHISQTRYDESPEIMLRPEDILICKDGAGIGKLGIVEKLPSISTINSSLLLIRKMDEISPKYLYYNLLSPFFQNIVNSRLMGATTPHLYQRDIINFPVPLPPLPEQAAIVARVEALLERVSALEAESARQRAWAEGLLQAALREAMGG